MWSEAIRGGWGIDVGRRVCGRRGESEGERLIVGGGRRGGGEVGGGAWVGGWDTIWAGKGVGAYTGAAAGKKGVVDGVVAMDANRG